MLMRLDVCPRALVLECTGMFTAQLKASATTKIFTQGRQIPNSQSDTGNTANYQRNVQTKY